VTVSLGVTLPQFTSDPDRVIAAARHAEEVSLDSIWLFDHLWPLSGGKERPIFEQWSTLAYVAAATERITIGTLVSRSTLRHPVLLAKMAATVATIAPGRLVLTLGSGDSLSRDENQAFGIPYLVGDDRTRQLASTVSLVRDYMKGEPLTAVDEYASIEALTPSPSVEVPPRVWMAGNSKLVRDAARRTADGWNAWGKDAAWFGRCAREFDLDGFEMTWAGIGSLDTDDARGRTTPGTDLPERHVWGPPEPFASTLRDLADAGADHLIVTFPQASPETFEALATTVLPLLG
jgi:alkanesulfonate monooxygenase SsuD/methylene tetrahydromethanopterin reductase-like flavin-dependent oxidoreductase (luciferase family)